MIERDVYCYGLTSVQEKIIATCLPEQFHCYRVRKEDVLSDKTIQSLVSKSWVTFIDPRKLSVEELTRIAKAHRHATHHSHVAKLVFTERLTKKQKSYEVIGHLYYSNLRDNWQYYKTLTNIIEARDLYLNGAQWMQGKKFGDEWYLVSLETTGNQVMCDSILSLSLLRMVDYRIKEVETLYIKQDRPLPQEPYRGITNEMLDAGITREEAVAYLNSISAPIIIGDDRRDIPFLQMLYRLCGQRFDLPALGMRGLSALVISYLGIPDYHWRNNMFSDFFRERCSCILPRRYERQNVSDAGLIWLCEMTLSVFENLEQRYNVHDIDELVALYDTIAPKDDN